MTTHPFIFGLSFFIETLGLKGDRKMKRIVMSCLVLLLLVNIVSAGDEGKWFDFEKCAFCSQLAKYPGLFPNMKSEFHSISNGLVTVVHVDSAYREAYEKAQTDMLKVAQNAQTTGTIPYMCGHCAGWAAFMMIGVKQEIVRTEFAEIVIMTSNDSLMVKKLQEFGDRCTLELAKIKSNK
jgi:hypothetical protein